MKKKFITPEIGFFKLSSEDICSASSNEDVIDKGDQGFEGSGDLNFNDIG